MGNIATLCILALICVFASVPAAAKTSRTAAKKVPASSAKARKKTIVASKGSRTSSGKRLAAKGKSSRRGAPVREVRRSPRQNEPTVERYMEIQQALVDKGYHPGPVTGQWGPEWVSALKEFQQGQSLNADGKLGALSLIALGLGPKRDSMAQFAGKPAANQP